MCNFTNHEIKEMYILMNWYAHLSNVIQSNNKLIWSLHAEGWWKENIKSLFSVSKPLCFLRAVSLYARGSVPYNSFKSKSRRGRRQLQPQPCVLRRPVQCRAHTCCAQNQSGSEVLSSSMSSDRNTYNSLRQWFERKWPPWAQREWHYYRVWTFGIGVSLMEEVCSSVFLLPVDPGAELSSPSSALRLPACHLPS